MVSCLLLGYIWLFRGWQYWYHQYYIEQPVTPNGFFSGSFSFERGRARLRKARFTSGMAARLIKNIHRVQFHSQNIQTISLL